MKKIISLLIAILFTSSVFSFIEDTGNVQSLEEIKNQKEEVFCTEQYLPVCGVDGKTYSNSCYAKNIKIAYQGECEKSLDNGEASPENQFQNTIRCESILDENICINSGCTPNYQKEDNYRWYQWDNWFSDSEGDLTFSSCSDTVKEEIIENKPEKYFELLEQEIESDQVFFEFFYGYENEMQESVLIELNSASSEYRFTAKGSFSLGIESESISKYSIDKGVSYTLRILDSQSDKVLYSDILLITKDTKETSYDSASWLCGNTEFVIIKPGLVEETFKVYAEKTCEMSCSQFNDCGLNEFFVE